MYKQFILLGKVAEERLLAEATSVPDGVFGRLNADVHHG